MNELEKKVLDLQLEVETLRFQVDGFMTVLQNQHKINDALHERILNLSAHCQNMFEAQLEGQNTLSAGISNISNRLHDHLMKPEAIL